MTVHLVNPTIKEDFDRLGWLDSEGWTHHNHYQQFFVKVDYRW